ASYASLLPLIARALDYVSVGTVDLTELETSLRERFARSPIWVALDNADWLEADETLIPRLDALIAPGRLLLAMHHQPVSAIPLHLLPLDPLPPQAFENLLAYF